MCLQSLPLETLQYIAELVTTSYSPSLRAFSLTSKACHSASTIFIFQRISIVVRDFKSLQYDVEQLVKALIRTDSCRHVRTITIKGALKPVKRPDGYERVGFDSWAISSRYDEIHERPVIHYSGLHVVYDEPVIKKLSDEDMAWAPIVQLLQLTQPRDLIWDTRSQFPPSLLSALHERHPRCRLHHLTFRFRTLLWGTPYPYEMELATSPNLYRLQVACGPRDSDYDDDFNLEAVMELARGLAPNLREAVVHNLRPGRSLKPVRPRERWLGLPGSSTTDLGVLTSLHLPGILHWNNSISLEPWARHIDLTQVKHLILGGGYVETLNGLSGEPLEWVAINRLFPQVSRLEVRLARDDYDHPRPRYSEQASSFFDSFEPLEQLSVYGPIGSEILDVILSHHGRTLRDLTLHPIESSPYLLGGNHVRREIPFEFSEHFILQIEEQCPRLEYLSIPIKRDRSSRSEVSLYKCLGRIKSLYSLFLILDCSNWRVGRDSTYNPQFDEVDQTTVVLFSDQRPLRKGHVREAFINCAVDQALACSIYQLINQSKTGRRLDRLKLWTTGVDEWGSRPERSNLARDICPNLARSWLVERMPRDDKEAFIVKELEQQARETQDEQRASYLAYHREHNHVHESKIWEVFHSIWPPKEGRQDWRDDWSSYPLQD